MCEHSPPKQRRISQVSGDEERRECYRQREKKCIRVRRLRTVWGILGTGKSVSAESTKMLERQALRVS